MMTLPVSITSLVIPCCSRAGGAGETWCGGDCVGAMCRVPPPAPALPVPPDDFLQPGGDVAPFAASFGNSWKIPDIGLEVLGQSWVLGGAGAAESHVRLRVRGGATPVLRVPPCAQPACRDVAELGLGCVVGDTVRQAAEAICGKLLAEPFRQCHGEVSGCPLRREAGRCWGCRSHRPHPPPLHQVDPGGFYAACLEVQCREGDAGSSPPPAVCDTFAAYARDCARHQTYVDWRQPAFCGRDPGGGVWH